jgi:hypothetical protein
MVKVSKSVAENKFNGGAEIAVIPSKVNPTSVWGKTYLSWMRTNGEPDAFEKLCNAVRYYNCNKELGMGLAYYLKEA